MFKNALVYRITQWQRPELSELDERLAAARFVECAPTQPESAGWLAPRGEQHGAMVESIDGQWLMRLAIETRAVPGSAVKQRLEGELDKIEAETGRRPKGKRSKELKEQIVHELLPRAFAKRSSTLVWVDPKAALVMVDTASLKRADRVLSLLLEALGEGAALALLQTRSSPATAMSQWLKTREAPAGFSIDRECELRQPDTEKSSVRYARHPLDIDEVALHIEQGKLPTQLAMTWDSRVSFVLTESMALKKIQLLDVVLDGAKGQDEGFDTDVAIATGELRRLIPDLLSALDGEQVDDEPAVQEPAAEPQAA